VPDERSRRLSIEALNVALQNVASSMVRRHVCSGNGAAPRAFDPPLKDLIGILLHA
jgi:hypothetical protein